MSLLYKYTKKYLEFLEQYGYRCVQQDQGNRVNLVGKNNCIAIICSIFEYELTCYFVDELKNACTLEDALRYADITQIEGFYQLSRKDDVEKGVIYLADALKNLFNKVDMSDSENFKQVLQYSYDRRKILLKRYYCKIDLKKAEDFWKAHDYTKAAALYEKHIGSLSKLQIKKLEYIKKNSHF